MRDRAEAVPAIRSSTCSSRMLKASLGISLVVLALLCCRLPLAAQRFEPGTWRGDTLAGRVRSVTTVAHEQEIALDQSAGLDTPWLVERRRYDSLGRCMEVLRQHPGLDPERRGEAELKTITHEGDRRRERSWLVKGRLDTNARWVMIDTLSGPIDTVVIDSMGDGGELASRTWMPADGKGEGIRELFTREDARGRARMERYVDGELRSEERLSRSDTELIRSTYIYNEDPPPYKIAGTDPNPRLSRVDRFDVDTLQVEAIVYGRGDVGPVCFDSYERGLMTRRHFWINGIPDEPVMVYTMDEQGNWARRSTEQPLLGTAERPHVIRIETRTIEYW